MVLWTGIRRVSSQLRKGTGRRERQYGQYRENFLVETFRIALNTLPAGYQDLGKLTKKLSKEEVNSLLVKLDTDGDGQLSFEEFKVLFENAEKRKKVTEKKSQENLIRHHSAKVSAVIYVEAATMVAPKHIKPCDLSNTV